MLFHSVNSELAACENPLDKTHHLAELAVDEVDSLGAIFTSISVVGCGIVAIAAVRICSV
jgi:hypothetical protein